MSTDIQAQIDGTLAFGRHLSWADLLNRLYEEQLQRSYSGDDEEASRDHEWRCFGLMCLWYGGLHVAVEGYEQLGLLDPVVDKLLAHPRDFRRLLRRYRNGVFHAQATMLDRRLLDLLDEGELHVWWVRALHDEIVRSYADHLHQLVRAPEQQREMRDSIEAILHWYPYREAPTFDALDRMLARGREVMARHPDTESPERDEFVRSLQDAESLLHSGRTSWHALRADILRQAGVCD